MVTLSAAEKRSRSLINKISRLWGDQGLDRVDDYPAEMEGVTFMKGTSETRYEANDKIGISELCGFDRSSGEIMLFSYDDRLYLSIRVRSVLRLIPSSLAA